MVGLDCSIIMNPKVWEASGHVGGFSDPMVDCKETKKRYRADQARADRRPRRRSCRSSTSPTRRATKACFKTALKKAEKAARAAGKKFAGTAVGQSFMAVAAEAARAGLGGRAGRGGARRR